jgi:hypothetical protein
MNQRQMYRKGKLSKDRIQRLEAIEFIWCRQDLLGMKCTRDWLAT